MIRSLSCLGRAGFLWSKLRSRSIVMLNIYNLQCIIYNVRYTCAIHSGQSEGGGKKINCDAKEGQVHLGGGGERLLLLQTTVVLSAIMLKYYNAII